MERAGRRITGISRRRFTTKIDYNSKCSQPQYELKDTTVPARGGKAGSDDSMFFRGGGVIGDTNFMPVVLFKEGK